MKKIAIIGVTGSIGGQAVDIIRKSGGAYSISLVSAHSNLGGLISLANEFRVPNVCYTGKESFSAQDLSYPCRVFTGEGALVRAAEESSYDVFLNSVVGIASLEPTIAAMKKGARIALSNKEMLVCAGEFVMDLAKKLSSEIIPVDSEHSALFQCLQAGKRSEVESLIITSSGGAFRDVPLREIDSLDPSVALSHPNWNMGKKITVDCATMVNKGFEVIEAMHLFEMPIEKIETVIHRESIVHSMVRFADGAVIAQLANPDMRLPIAYAFSYPDRVKTPVSRLPLDLNLSFKPVDLARYPAFAVALEAAKKGGLYGACYMAADDVLVPMYLSGKIGYFDLARVLEKVVSHFQGIGGAYDLSDVFNINAEARKYTLQAVGEV